MIGIRFGLVAALMAAVVSGTVVAGPVNTTATYQGPTTTAGSWTDGANWSSTPDHPSGVGAGAIFNNAAGNRTINVTPTTGESPVTVGSITINNSSASSNTINGGTSGANYLTFDAVGAGPATVTVTGDSTGSSVPNTISARTAFEDTVVVSVDPNSNTSPAADLAWIGAVIDSPGGFTKTGDGLLSLTNNGKLFTGPTLFDTNSGRTRISVSGSPTATSSVTVMDGAQLTLISNSGIYTWGAGPLNLNGTGLGPSSSTGNFPGAIRNDTNLDAEITNDVVLQSDTLIHVQGAASGVTTLSGDVSGVGRLDLTALNSDFNLGRLVLTGTNSYQGGSVVNGGALVAGGASTTAFGTGDVTVQSFAAGAAARIILESGAGNVIDDAAILSLAGGNAALTADDGYAELGAGVNETVGGLILGGVAQTSFGTYGSTASGATFQDDEYFSGTGVITLAAVDDADFDADGDVDGADFLTWQRNVGITPGTANLEDGDANGDDDVDGDDLLAWENQFGTATAAASAVPEPGAALLALLAAPLALLARRKR
jgi:autotransporter-associated beta strand protein